MKNILVVLLIILTMVEMLLFFELNSLTEPARPLATVSPTFYAKGAHPVEDTVHVITPVYVED